jgi:hypothetical protein
MKLTLDYNIELFPLQLDQSFALALASSLARGGTQQGAVGADGTTEESDDKDRDVWRPDGKGRRGLEEDYEYVMYGKVRFPVGLSARSTYLFSRCTNSTAELRRSCASYIVSCSVFTSL